MVGLVLEAEVHADCSEITLLKLVVGEAPQKGRFSNRAVPDYYYLEQIVVFPYHIYIFTLHSSSPDHHICLNNKKIANQYHWLESHEAKRV